MIRPLNKYDISVEIRLLRWQNAKKIERLIAVSVLSASERRSCQYVPLSCFISEFKDGDFTIKLQCFHHVFKHDF